MPKELLLLSAGSANNYLLNLTNYLNQLFHRRNLGYNCVMWTDSLIYENGVDTITALAEYGKKLKESNGYVLCLFTPDDEIIFKGKRHYVSRDNVWLEYGLFSGILGSKRVFAVCPEESVVKNEKSGKWHRPSDFTTQEYRYTYADNVDNICDRLQLLSTQIVDRIDIENKPIQFTGNRNDNDYETGFSFNAKQP